MGPLAVPALLALLAAAAPDSEAGFDPAREHYDGGKQLFEAGNKEQALIEFRLSYEASGNVEALFSMAQCEYHLGRLRDARAHYQQYLESAGRSPEAAQIARLRIAAIDSRPATVAVTTDPDEVDVRLEGLDGDRRVYSGQAPNDFEVARGRYRVTVSRKNYVTQAREITVATAETTKLRFKLDPVPARLVIQTFPSRATLYVHGNRARNPYSQDVAPGSYEIYAEATDYESRSDVVVVAPGEQRVVEFPLRYVQRSGRPELIGFWTVVGALAGAAAVSERLSPDPTATKTKTVTGKATVVTAGALVGAMGGAVISTAFVPNYIRDNLALFRIGTAWIGAAEGASLALTLRRTAGSAWVGGAAGLATGAIIGSWRDDRAPNYGRVALIQSGAAMGALAGVGLVPALELDAERHTPLTLLGGLNLGLGVGLALAYLPDQRQYGPTWQRVVLVDLAAVTGAVTGALFSTVGQCLQSGGDCKFKADERTAQLALVGGGLGLAAGWFLTRNYDKDHAAPAERSSVALMPVPTVLPVTDAEGRTRALPGLAAQGRF